MTRRDTILKAWNGAWGDGDLSAFEQLLAPGYVRRSKTGAEDYAALRKTIEAMHTAFPDSRTEILEIIEDGPKAAIHWQTTGTHTGEFMDVPATGRSIAVTVVRMRISSLAGSTPCDSRSLRARPSPIAISTAISVSRSTSGSISPRSTPACR